MNFLNKNSINNSKTILYPNVAEGDPIEIRILEKYGKTKNTLDSTANINGKVCFDTSMRIEGKLTGEIDARKTVIVGRSGIIQAKIRAESLVVLGIVKGDIEVTKGIEILAGGCVEGSILTPSISIETGATFNGSCLMKQEIVETKIIIFDKEEKNSEKQISDNLINGEFHESEILHH